MRWINSLLFASVPALVTTGKPPHGYGGRTHVNGTNANHIFNSVIDGMRQFGGSLHHNGMTFFLAHIPAGTEFYHGTTSSTRVNGTQWLAFEPEHALEFARVRMPPPRPPPFAKNKASDTSDHVPESRQHSLHYPGDNDDKKIPPVPPKKGYLHTYRTIFPLRLIYVDGQSAAKSTKGTLDTQDLVIRDPSRRFSPAARVEPPAPPGNGGGGPMGENERAAELCAVANIAWEGRIHGILRMEAGFEVILCSFAKDLKVVHIKTVSVLNTSAKAPPMAHDGLEMLVRMKSIASRYDGIGDHRVNLDYDRMISLYNYKDLVYIDRHGLPRVNNQSMELSRARRDLTNLATRGRGRSRDWKGIADMIVSRYSDNIQFLASGLLADKDEILEMVNAEMKPFVDVEKRNVADEVEACAAQFWPQDLYPVTSVRRLSTAAQAIRNVALKICNTFSEARGAEDVASALALFKELQEWLAWSTFKRCRGCAVNEVCVLPIWPMGTKEDYLRPNCQGKDKLSGRPGSDSYWGDHGTPGRPSFPGPTNVA